MQAILRTKDGESLGETHGHQTGTVTELRAPEGYAVGGVIVKSGRRMDGIAVVFLRLRDGRLDPRDHVISDWVGGRGGGGDHFSLVPAIR